MPDLMMRVLAGLFMIGVLVVVHEAGHFVAAKLFRVGVPVFSIGMGPRLFGFAWRGTDYRISALPIGGYVQMAGADPFGEQDASARVDPAEDFMRKPVWQRLIIMAAGPAVNLVLPFFVFTVLLMAGRPDIDARVGTVIPGTPAADLGLRDGDRILAVDGAAVQIWHDVTDHLEARVEAEPDAPIPLTLERDGQQLQVSIPAGLLRLNAHEGLDFTGLGLAVWHSGPYRGPMILSARVGVEDPASPAGVAGLRTGDHITSVDGTPVDSWDEVMAALGDRGEHELEVERGYEAGELETASVRLAVGETPWRSAAPAFDNPWGLQPLMLFASSVGEGDPAGRAGVRANDRFVSVDGKPVLTFDHFIEHVAESAQSATGAPRPLELVVVRDGALRTMSLVPELRVVTGEAYSRPIIGVTSYAGTYLHVGTARKYYSLFEAVPRAVAENVDVVQKTAAVLGNVLTGRTPAQETVGGPVAIFQMAGVVVEAGWFAFATTIGMISVSLGVINLLPVPVLDGGQIAFYLVEWLRGRPLSLELRERFQMVGVVALMIVMVLVMVNDVSRWFGG